VLDLSQRPYLAYHLDLSGRIGDLESETFQEWWRAFTIHAGATIHVDLIRGLNRHHKVESAFKALGLALAQATALQGDEVPSSKGLLG
jgi:imidazoleglycerol-phosphate dehydratase